MNIKSLIALGWTPELAVVEDGVRRVVKVVGWAGGNGTVPASNVFLGTNGFVTNITDGEDIRGAAGAASVNISAGTTSNNLTNFVFSNDNGVTFGLNGSTITASVNAGGGTMSAINLSAGSTSNNLTAFQFNNGGGVSFGLDGSTVTATVATNYQSQGAYLTTAMASNAGSNFIGTNTALTANGVSMTANSSGLSLNFPAFLTTAAQSNHSHNFATTTTNGSVIVVATTNSAGATIAVPPFLTTAQSAGAYLTTAAQSNQVVNSLNGSTGQISLNVGSSLSASTNGSSITFGLASNITTALQSAGAYLTTAMQSNAVTLSNIRVSAGTTSNLLSALTLGNSNGVSFGLNAGTITASHNGLTTAAQSNQVINSLNGSTGQISLNVGSSLSASTNGSSITFGLASNITTALQSAGAYLTTAAQSNQVVNSLNGSTGQISLNVGSSLSSSTNGSSITFGLASNITTALQSAGAYLTTAMQSNAVTLSNIRVSAGTTSNLLSALTFSNINGVSFGINASTITASHNGLTTARASNDGVGLNTAQTNVTWTVNSSGLSLNAAGYAGTGTTFNGANISGSITQNSNGINLSLSAAAPGGGGSINFSGGTTSGNLASITFGNGGGVSFGLNAGVMTAQAPAGAPSPVNFSAGTTSNNLASVVFATGNGITFGLGTGVSSQSITASYNSTQFAGTGTSATNASITLNSNGLAISVAAPGGGGITKSTYIPYYPASTGAQTIGAQGATSASAWFFPVSVEHAVRFNQIEQLMTASWVSSSVAFSHTVTHQFGIFSNNAGTLSLISSSSYSVAATGSTVSATLSYPSAYGTAGGYTYTTVGASSTATAQSLFGTVGNRIMTFGFGNTMELTEGLYWLGIHARQSSSSANGGMAFALAGNVFAAAQNAGRLGASTVAFTGSSGNTLFKIPWGVATSTGSAGYGGSRLPDAVNVTAMGMTATQVPMMTFISR